jgi:hypothetical protein
MTRPRPERRGATLADVGREFWRHPTPWLLSAAFLISLVARVAVGDWQWSDAVLPLVVVAVFPFAEWMIHVFILHWRPRRIGGVMIDTALARKHREHHADPRVIPLIFIPLQSLFGAFAAGLAVAVLAFPRLGLGLTFLVTLFAIGVVYEWSHYLVHTDYKPKSWFYTRLYRNHRWHHYKNEHYWFAVTTPGLADRVLGTYPDPTTVPTSPTAKNLHAGAAKTPAAQRS